MLTFIFTFVIIAMEIRIRRVSSPRSTITLKIKEYNTECFGLTSSNVVVVVGRVI